MKVRQDLEILRKFFRIGHLVTLHGYATVLIIMCIRSTFVTLSVENCNDAFESVKVMHKIRHLGPAINNSTRTVQMFQTSRESSDLSVK